MPPDRNDAPTGGRSRFLVLAALALLYLALLLALDGLRFPLRGDETHFWPTSLLFSHSPVPQVEALRSYGELSTPLPFVLWGELEYWFHQGVWLPRLLHLALSFAMLCVIAWPTPRSWRHRALAAAGILLCPYFLIVSSHLYTDLLAIFFSLFGVIAHLRRRYLLAAALFILAIATRQYMVAFPAMLALRELATASRERTHPRSAWLAPVLATLSLGGWYLFFGDFGPRREIEDQAIATARAAAVLPRNSLYFLACVGLYFTLPEHVLYRRKPWPERFPSPRALLPAAALLALFVRFPPLRNDRAWSPTMGFFDRALHLTGLSDAGRAAVFYLFAVLAVYGLRERPLSLLFLAGNALLMAKAHLAWDKYALPLLVVLWYLKSRWPEHEPSRQPLPPSGHHPAPRTS